MAKGCKRQPVEIRPHFVFYGEKKMKLQHVIKLWHIETLRRGNDVYHKSEMINWVKKAEPMANTESIERQHRKSNEERRTNYVCFDKANGWYKSLPLKGEDKELAVIHDET
jgi:hypothetical protein